MVARKKRDIDLEIINHFENAHNRHPVPDPRDVDYNLDFKKALVVAGAVNGLCIWDGVKAYIYFTTRRYCSEDYCIAVITWKDYKGCLDNPSQENLRGILRNYFM